MGDGYRVSKLRTTIWVLPVVLALLVSCEGSDDGSRLAPAQSEARTSAPAVLFQSACRLRGAADLAARLGRVIGSGDEAAVADILAEEHVFRWVSDSNVEPAVALPNLAEAVAYLANDAPAYQLQEVRVTRRPDGSTADVAWTALDETQGVVLGKGEFQCSPPAVSAWTAGSSGSLQLCPTNERVVRLDGIRVCSG